MPSPKLNDLFISKVRVKLIQTFLTHPEEIFYVRQLVRMTEEEINAVRRELAHMEGGDMVRKEVRGNRLYYEFKKNYVFYDQLAGMVAKTTGLGCDILRLRSKLGKLVFVVFSYRFARYLPPASSDEIDVLIVGEIVLPEINVLVKSAEARIKREINYTVMTDKELETRKRGRDQFLLSILERPLVMIIGDEEKVVS